MLPSCLMELRITSRKFETKCIDTSLDPKGYGLKSLLVRRPLGKRPDG
jgi:hypothetical protein